MPRKKKIDFPEDDFREDLEKQGFSGQFIQDLIQGAELFFDWSRKMSKKKAVENIKNLIDSGKIVIQKPSFEQVLENEKSRNAVNESTKRKTILRKKRIE